MRCPRCGKPQPPILKPEGGWTYAYKEIYDTGEEEYEIERYICPDCNQDGATQEDTENWWF